MNQYLISLIMSLCFSSGIILRYMPFHRIISKKQRRLLFIGYIVALCVNGLVMIPVFAQNSRSASIVEMDMLIISTVTTLWNVIVIRKHIREHLFVFGLVLSSNYLILTIPVYFASGVLLEKFAFNLPTVLAGIVLLFAAFWPIRWLLLRTVTPFLQLESGDYWNTIWFIPLALYLSMVLTFPNDVTATTMPQVVSCVLTGVVMILLCLNVAKDHRHVNERAHAQRQLTEQKIHYAQLQQQVRDTRAKNHDLKHHMAAIQHFIDTDNKAGLQEYCNDFLAHSKRDIPIPYTGNVAADGVVYRYMQLAHQHNIHFQYAGKIHSSGISDMDLCVLLGNALDNALTGCLSLEEGRSIHLISSIERGLLSIMVRNTFDGTVEQEGGNFLSRKRVRTPGVGMESMRTVCDRYGGTMQVDWNEDTFSIVFLLPTKE